MVTIPSPATVVQNFLLRAASSTQALPTLTERLLDPDASTANSLRAKIARVADPAVKLINRDDHALLKTQYDRLALNGFGLNFKNGLLEIVDCFPPNAFSQLARRFGRSSSEFLLNLENTDSWVVLEFFRSLLRARVDQLEKVPYEFLSRDFENGTHVGTWVQKTPASPSDAVFTSLYASNPLLAGGWNGGRALYMRGDQGQFRTFFHAFVVSRAELAQRVFGTQQASDLLDEAFFTTEVLKKLRAGLEDQCKLEFIPLESAYHSQEADRKYLVMAVNYENANLGVNGLFLDLMQNPDTVGFNDFVNSFDPDERHPIKVRLAAAYDQLMTYANTVLVMHERAGKRAVPNLWDRRDEMVLKRRARL
ncbi:MAG: hypothetical protein H7A33_00020 [Deltaproteobacteria bacterium]|nr:hypothetical protein [Deltaproteobacteria bacterium]